MSTALESVLQALRTLLPPFFPDDAFCILLIISNLSLHCIQKPKAFKPALDRDKVTDLIEAEESEDLDALEDDFQDDSFLEQYRYSDLSGKDSEAMQTLCSTCHVPPAIQSNAAALDCDH